MTHQRNLIGVGIGKPHEPVGLVLLNRAETIGELDAKRGRWNVITRLQVAEVRTIARGDEYGAIAAAILELAAEPKAPLLVDITVCGRAALPPLRDRGLKPVPIVTVDTVGARAKNRVAFEVGRPELRSAVLVAAEEGRLKLGKSDGAQDLLAQMAAARGSRPRKPGDFEVEPRFELANALAIAVWWSEHRMRPQIEQPRLPPLPIEIRPPTFNEAMAAARR